jgi:hypothetical protein
LPNLNEIIGDPWGTLITFFVILLPAVIRHRAELTRYLDIIAELFGLVVLVGGVVLYTEMLPQWERFQANITQLAGESPAFAADYLQTLHILHSGSIALMVLGGLVALFGLLGRVRPSARQAARPPLRR